MAGNPVMAQGVQAPGILPQVSTLTMDALMMLPARLSTSMTGGLFTCNAILCKAVHLRRPDLNLQREQLLSAQRQHSGVQ